MDFLCITEIIKGKCVDCGAELAYSGRAGEVHVSWPHASWNLCWLLTRNSDMFQHDIFSNVIEYFSVDEGIRTAAAFSTGICIFASFLLGLDQPLNR